MLAQPKNRFAWVQAIPYIVFLGLVFSVFALTPDDPYITYRYAANTLAGYGPVFNPGERVEGFSSPLHLLEAIGLLWMLPSIDILIKAKIAGLLCGLIVLYQTDRLARRIGLSPSEALLAQILLALNLNFAASSVNGLETTLYALLLILTLNRFVIESGSGKGFGSGFLVFLAVAARPDALVVFLALAVLRVLWLRRYGFPRRWLVGWLLTFLTLAVCLELARLTYYHAPLPNTYYAKSVSLSYGLRKGLLYLSRPLYLKTRDFMSGLGLLTRLYIGCCIPVFWVLAGIGMLRVHRQRAGQVCIAVCLAILLFILKAGGDWMLGWRFMVPALPMLAVLQSFGIRALSEWRPRRQVGSETGSALILSASTFSHRILITAVAAFWTVAALISPHTSWAKARFSVHGVDLLAISSQLRPNEGRQLIAVANYIRDTFPPGTHLMYTEMGYAPYLNLDKRFLDRLGLVNYEIARIPSAFRSQVGILDAGWYLPSSPLYAIIQRVNPDVIIGTEETPPVIFGNFRVAPKQPHVTFARFYVR